MGVLAEGWSSRAHGHGDLYAGELAVSPDFTHDRTLYYGLLGLARSTDGGRNWMAPADTTVVSFRSCVQYFPNAASLISVGRGGVSAFSNDDGKHWTNFGALGLYTLSVAKSGEAVWAAGPDGAVARLVLE